MVDDPGRLSRFYATLTRVNSAIIHCTDEQQLYDAICVILADKGGFAGATVRRADWSRRKAVMVANEGAWRNSSLRHLIVELDLDDPESRTVMIKTLLSGAPVTVNVIHNGESIGPRYRAAIQQLGICAMSTVPLTCFGETVAVLALSSSEEGFFSDDILALIAEVGRDVSFALENIAREAQRKQAEELLARNEENLRVTLRSIGDAVLATDTEGRVTLMNPVAEALTGWSEAEARGRPLAEIFHIINEKTRREVESPVAMVLRDGQSVGLANHTLLIARDGRECPIADSAAPIRPGADGVIGGVVLVFRDQSEERAMLKALHDSERLYASLVETAPVGIFQCDLNGAHGYANDAMRRLAGLENNDFSFEHWREKQHPEDRQRLLEYWRRAVDVGGIEQITYRYLRADGGVTWVKAQSAPVTGDNGERSGVVFVVTDITAEYEYRFRIERLSRFNATLSHINSTIVRCATEQELYEKVCRIMTERGGFTAAAAYVADWPERKANLDSYFGPGKEYVKSIARFVELRNDRESWNVATAALLSGTTIFTNDFRVDERLSAHWREKTEAFDMVAAAAAGLPFSRFGETVAVLALFSEERGYFSADILALIEEVRRDVSHALENIARERQRKLAEENLARSEERLRLGLSITQTGMYEVDFSTNRIAYDAVSARLMNLGDEALEIAIDTSFSMSSEEGKAVLYRMYEELKRGLRDSYSDDTPLPLPDGSVRWLRNHGGVTAERTAQGLPLRLLGVISDITATRSLEERDRLAMTVFENSSESIMIVNAESQIIMVNRAFTKITGYSAEEALGRDSDMLRSNRHDAAFYRNIQAAIERDNYWQGETWRRRRNGEIFPALAAISAVKNEGGKAAYYVLQEIDISEQKASEERISYLAYRDPLTGLPNRALLRDRVEQSIASAHRENGAVALLFLDLDHFKNINDSLGHTVGDRLLKEVAQRLIGATREMDTVGRLGGDEFLVVLPGTNADAAGYVAQKLLEESARPFAFEGHSLMVTPSLGIALYPKDGEDFDELLKKADTAMYRAKNEGRNTCRFFTPEMNEAVFRRLVLESSLRHAIEKREFVLHYQPKFELSRHALVGVEALIRWHQPEMGMVPPAQFVPVAEDSGLIEAIGQWVLGEACRQVKAWQDEGLPLVRVAVNFSARQFAARNVAELVADTLQKTGLSGAGLEVEITESLLAQDMEYTFKVLQSLKGLGVDVAVDDFGTGYSSLSYLKRFPIDRLKIDQSFVRDLVNDADDRAIATAVVTLGHSLGIRVIAEGVETAQQMEILRDMGCDEVQGYYLGRPISAAEMTVALRKLGSATPSRGA